MKKITQLLAIGVTVLFLLCACEQEGPAEKTGKKIDETTEETGEAIKDKSEDIKDSAEDAADKAEDNLGNSD